MSVKIIEKFGRRQFTGLLLSCIPFIGFRKLTASSEQSAELLSFSSHLSPQFYLLSGWVLAESDLEFLTDMDRVNAKRLQ